MTASQRLVFAAVGWVGAFAVTFVVSMVASVLFVANTERPLSEWQDALGMGGLVLLSLPLWLGLAGTPLLARRWGLDWRTQLGWRMRAVDIPIGLGVGVAMQIVAVPLLYWPIFKIFGDLDVEGPARELTGLADNDFDIVLLVATTVVIAPVVEELFFRGLLQGALCDGVGRVWGVLIASAAFGVTHVQGVQLPALVLVGAVHGLLVLRTGRLGPAIWSHVAFNAVTVVVLTST